MSNERDCLPDRPQRGVRVRRAVVGVAAGALLLLGAACGGSADADPEATGQSDDAVASVAGSEPIRALETTDGIVAAAVAEAPADTAPTLPDWVTAKLEADPPPLALTWPREGTVVTNSYIVFSGQAEPGATVAAGPYQAKADEFGQWNLGLVLSDGQNVATFSVISEEGVETKESVTVHFKSPYKDKYVAKDGTEYKDPDHYKNKDAQAFDGFEAWQKYGSCGEDVPYDVFKGKATPGTTVTVTSPYGGGSAVAGDDGYWKLKVTFEAAPVGEPFTVTVSDGSEVKTFTFTRKQ